MDSCKNHPCNSSQWTSSAQVHQPDHGMPPFPETSGGHSHPHLFSNSAFPQQQYPGLQKWKAGRGCASAEYVSGSAPCLAPQDAQIDSDHYAPRSLGPTSGACVRQISLSDYAGFAPPPQLFAQCPGQAPEPAPPCHGPAVQLPGPAVACRFLNGAATEGFKAQQGISLLPDPAIVRYAPLPTAAIQHQLLQLTAQQQPGLHAPHPNPTQQYSHVAGGFRAPLLIMQHPSHHSFAAPQHHPARQQGQQEAEPRRTRIRRPSARRSLGGMFNLAAKLQMQDEQQMQEEGAAATLQGVFARGAPWRQEQEEEREVGGEGATDDEDAEMRDARWEGSSANRPPISCTSLADPFLPLQSLLLSDRARQLTTLEVKAIIYRVCCDLAGLHAQGAGPQCQVSISSIALAPSGDLATTRLLSSPTPPDGAPATHLRRDSTGSANSSSTTCSSAAVGLQNLYGLGSKPRRPLCALGLGARWGGLRQQQGPSAHSAADLLGVDAGVAAYVPPEAARAGSAVLEDNPSADMWSLGVVLFVLLSGGYVPFGHRGLCETCIPNMPGPTEKMDSLQEWLEAHLCHKVAVIQQISLAQAQAPPQPEMRVVGFDYLSCDLLLSLLKADPAQRLSAQQALSHPWLSEVVGLLPSRPPSHGAAVATPGGGLRKVGWPAGSGHGGALAPSCFSPCTPTVPIDVLSRGPGTMSLTPPDSECCESFKSGMSEPLRVSGLGFLDSGDAFTPLQEDPRPPPPQPAPPSLAAQHGGAKASAPHAAVPALLSPSHPQRTHSHRHPHQRQRPLVREAVPPLCAHPGALPPPHPHHLPRQQQLGALTGHHPPPGAFLPQ